VPKDKLLEDIGTKIKKIRHEKGISQQELAAICNFEKSNMSRIESGRTNATILTLRKIAHALDIELHELLS
jgi:transcriptional regulator with XRE-family HTH domain